MNYQKQNHYNTYKATVKPPPKWRFDKLSAIIAAVFILTPFLYFQLFIYLNTTAIFISPCIAAAVFGLGYAAQILYSKLRKFDRVHLDGTYENMEQLFKPSRAAGPYVLAGVVAVVVFIAARAYLQWRVNTDIELYDKHAIFPIVIAFTNGIFVILGAIAWFYPVKWMVSPRFFVPLIPSMTVISIFLGMNGLIDIYRFAYWIVCILIATVFVIISYIFTRYYSKFMVTK